MPRGYRSRVWQILCGYQPAHRGEEVVTRKREEYAGYVNHYFNNKEEDIHKDTFRSHISHLSAQNKKNNDVSLFTDK